MSQQKYGVSGLKWRSITCECFWVPPLGSFLTVFLSEITMRLLTLCNKPLLYLRTPKSATMIKCVSLVMLFPLFSHYPAKCHNQFPWIQGGGPKEPDLAQLLGWALSHWVSDSLMDIFTGVLLLRF